MPWFTPTFTAPPPPPTKPAVIYHTEAPPAPKLPARPAPAPRQTPATAPSMRVPPALRDVVYLDQHRQGTVRSALRMIGIQTRYRFVNDVRGRSIRIPADSGLVWISGNPNNAPAIDELLAIGRIVAPLHLTVQVDPNHRTITLMRDGKAAR